MKYLLNIQFFGGRGASVKTGTGRTSKLSSLNREELAEKSAALFKEKMRAKRNGEQFTKQAELDALHKQIAKLDEERANTPVESIKVSANGRYAANRDITTTTYDRARKRRMKNFEAWFNAGGKRNG